VGQQLESNTFLNFRTLNPLLVLKMWQYKNLRGPEAWKMIASALSIRWRKERFPKMEGIFMTRRRHMIVNIGFT